MSQWGVKVIRIRFAKKLLELKKSKSNNIFGKHSYQFYLTRVSNICKFSQKMFMHKCLEQEKLSIVKRSPIESSHVSFSKSFVDGPFQE